MDDLLDLRDVVGEEGVLLRRENGLRRAFNEDTTLLCLFQGVDKGDEAAVLESTGIGTCRVMFRGKGEWGRSLGFRGNMSKLSVRPRLRAGYDWGSVPCRRSEAADEEIVDVRRCASSDLLRTGDGAPDVCREA